MNLSKPKACPKCLHVIKLKVFESGKSWVIGRGCSCGMIEQLSWYYDDPNEARIDLVSFSWAMYTGGD